MKTFGSASLILAGLCVFSKLAIAQGIPADLPACLNPCLPALLNAPACRNVGDIQKCICTNKELIDSVACCAGKHCSGNDIEQVKSFANKLCAVYDVTLPSQPTCSGSGGSSSTTTSTMPSNSPSNSGNGDNGDAGSHVSPSGGMAVAGVCAVLGLAGFFA